MTIFMFANNVDTTLAGPISSSATSLTLASTAFLPASIPAGQVLVITLNDQATRQNFEVIYATSISGATLSGLLRAQEGTAALSWSTGDFAYSAPTAGQQQNFGQLPGANTWTGANTFTQPVIVGAGAATGDAVNLGQFPSDLSGDGWKKYADPSSPSGFFIEQWGKVTLTSTGAGITSSIFSLPIQFPNSHLFCMAGYDFNHPDANLGAIAGYEYSLSQIEISIYTSTASPNVAAKYFAKGY